MTQSWVGKGPPSQEGWLPLGPRSGWCKPHGGMWTSTWRNETGSDWLVEGGPGNMDVIARPAQVWLLTPDPAARILEIAGVGDLSDALDLFGVESELGTRALDWPALARVYDGVHLSEAGQQRTRLSYPDNLYGWDCECTLWLRWSFIQVERWGIWKFYSMLNERS